MQIQEMRLKISDLVKDYSDNGDEGVFAYGGRLNLRPAYQREFVYNDKQQKAVIDTIMKGLPLNVFYYAKNIVRDEYGKETISYELMDGQQRSMSICKYINGDFSYNDRYYHNLSDIEKKVIDDYELLVYVCEGSTDERLAWFKTINIAGLKLNDQELRNAIYVGPWLSDAKRYFSKRECVAWQLGKEYISGAPERQDFLEKVLDWISDGNIEEYMATHQNDDNAEPLWVEYQKIINWVKLIFTKVRKEMKGLDWGYLYKTYSMNTYYPTETEAKISRLYKDSDVTNKKGIYEYILSGDQKHLNIRAFDDNTKATVYERQGHKCPRCVAEGNDKEYDIKEMDADHLLEWTFGGHTTIDNCQMLCHKHNRGDKSWKRHTQ